MNDWPKRDVRPLAAVVGSYDELELGRNCVQARGPVEALFLTQLWDLMLCMAYPERARKRFKVAPKFSSGYYESRTSYAYLPDETIEELFYVTQLEMKPAIFFRLWAPLCDPETGQLATNLHQKLRKILEREKIIPGDSENSVGRIIKNFNNLNLFVATLPGLRVDYTKRNLAEVRDPQGRLHCPHGPAIVCGDGTPFFFWRGVHVPSYFIPFTDEWRQNNPGAEPLKLSRPYRPMTPEHALGITNVERRRAACEIVGWHNILEQLQAEVVDTDPDPTIGELLRVMLPARGSFGGAGMIQTFLRVRCGTGRTFALVVPNECTTALEANAWTYGLSPEEYRPEVRT